MPALVPQPSSAHRLTGQTRVPAVVGYLSELPLSRWALDSLQHWLGAPIQPADAGTQAWLRVERDADVPPEGYRLLVRDGVHLAVSTASGLTNALHTLRQLAGPTAFAPPPGTREELPEVLRFIDNAAALKLNALHLHLTDDQGWRIEVPYFPRLTCAKSWPSPTNAASPSSRRSTCPATRWPPSPPIPSWGSTHPTLKSGPAGACTTGSSGNWCSNIEARGRRPGVWHERSGAH